MSTSEFVAAAGDGGGVPDALAGADGALPDLAALTRLANDLFRALPGAASGSGLPPAAVAPTPELAPSFGGGAAAPSVPLPDRPPLVSVVPGEGALRSLLTGADPIRIPATPSPSPTAPSPSSWGGPSSLGGLPAPRTVLPAPVPPGLSSVIPGESELRALLAAVAVPPSANAPGGLPSAGTPSFYFADAARPAPSATGPSSHPAFDALAARRDFPILNERVQGGKPLIWLDNAATTQKPQAVIDRLSHFYRHENSNIHRGAHELAARATDAYEAARDKTRRFLNAGSVDEVVFVRGTTEAINLVAQSWGRRNIGKGDEIVITWLEHHANIVPWQQLCAETGARLRVAPVDDHGQVLLDDYGKLLNRNTRLVSFTQVSNALGTVTPARKMIEMARAVGAHVLVDGAQSVSHMRTDVQALDCDWFVFSGHKVYAPTGIGVLYGKQEILEAMPPWQGGGNMIADVTFEKTEYQPAPAKFEAGTGNIADAVGLGAALDYVEKIGLEVIGRHEHDLLAYATRKLLAIPGLSLVGTAAEKAGVLSFVLDGFRSEDVGTALNKEGIAVRSGHHCAQPILRRFGLESSVRPSLGLYNTVGDMDALAAAVLRIKNRGPLSH